MEQKREIHLLMEWTDNSRIPEQLKLVYCTCNYSRLLHLPCCHIHCALRKFVSAVDDGSMLRRVSSDRNGNASEELPPYQSVLQPTYREWSGLGIISRSLSACPRLMKHDPFVTRNSDQRDTEMAISICSGQIPWNDNGPGGRGRNISLTDHIVGVPSAGDGYEDLVRELVSCVTAEHLPSDRNICLREISTQGGLSSLVRALAIRYDELVSKSRSISRVVQESPADSIFAAILDMAESALAENGV